MFCNFLEWPTKPKQINPQSFNRFQNRNKWEYSYSTSVDRPNLANPLLSSTTNHQQTIQFLTKQTILRIFFIHVCSRISHWPPSFASRLSFLHLFFYLMTARFTNNSGPIKGRLKTFILIHFQRSTFQFLPNLFLVKSSKSEFLLNTLI